MSPDRVVLRVVDVYVYRDGGEGREFLLLRRSAGRLYAGEWRAVGGKIEPRERAWEAARRELVEETGLRPRRLWTLPSANVFYEWQHDRVNVIPAFAAEVESKAEVTLNPENEGAAWFRPAAAAERLWWPEQQRLLRLAERLLARGPLAPEWELPLT